MIDKKRVALDDVLESKDLRSLHDLLTSAMKQQRHQELIRDDNLAQIVNTIVTLAASSPAEEELFAAAVLGRLAAVARSRESIVHSRIGDIFSDVPMPIESLADGDEKEYAARMLAFIKTDWRQTYCASQVLSIDAADNARKELLHTLLLGSDGFSSALRLLVDAQVVVKAIENVDARVKRVRRVFESLADVFRSYEGPVGREPGLALSEIMTTFLRGGISSDLDSAQRCMEAAVSMLVRVIELRFSNALHAETYGLLLDGKRLLGHGQWSRFLGNSHVLKKIRLTLLETALVLARQNRTDKQILRVMESTWESTAHISDAIRGHFDGAIDVAPDVADYWLKVGRVSQSERAVEHKLGNTEDQQIGELLIQLDANRDNMSKLNRAVVPVLETFDAIQAATVRRAASGYESIAQVAERLARMRKLSKTNFLGETVEYNPIEHDMEGGHRAGVRHVRVVRDGIMKEFAGKKKMLVKPRVEFQE
jgi:hypothetical protein